MTNANNYAENLSEHIDNEFDNDLEGFGTAPENDFLEDLDANKTEYTANDTECPF